MPFQDHRLKSHLLIPTKRPLTPSRSTTLRSNSQSQPVHLPFRNAITQTQTATTTASCSHNPESRRESRRVEVDFSAAPQPFLDPALWERMRAAEEKVEEEPDEAERERRREREGGYGELAVKRRVGGRIK